MSGHNVHEIAQAAARAAVHEFVYGPTLQGIIDNAVDNALQRVGIDTSDPTATRRDMVKLREWTEFWEFVRQKGIGATVTWVVTGALAALAIGVGVLIGRG